MDKKKSKDKGLRNDQEVKADRKAEALRANLQKRKSQARARVADPVKDAQKGQEHG